jgi:hypothetical protein
LIELLAQEMTADLRGERTAALKQARAIGHPMTAALNTKGVDFGKVTANPDGTVDNSSIQGVDADLTLRPFSQKGVFASLRQFTIKALNVHHGMEATEASERGGRARTTSIKTTTPTKSRLVRSRRWSRSRRLCRRPCKRYSTTRGGRRGAAWR